MIRRVLPLLAIAAVTIAASCEPIKEAPIKDLPPGGQGGENIAYYFVADSGRPDGTNVTRSATPFAAPVCDDASEAGAPAGGPGSHLVSGLPPLIEASQTLNDDGSITLSIVDPTGSRCSAATGFAAVVGLLGALDANTVGTTPDSDLVVSQLAFDADGDGNFGGDGTSFGDDAICEPGADGGVIREVGVAGVDDTTLFTCFDALGPVADQPTLQQLKDGFPDLAGIDASTPVAVEVALRNRSATVDSFTINGVEQL